MTGHWPTRGDWPLRLNKLEEQALAVLLTHSKDDAKRVKQHWKNVGNQEQAALYPLDWAVVRLMSPFLSCVCTPLLLTVCSISFLAHELSCFCDKQLICLDLSFTLLLILVLLFLLSPQFKVQFSLGSSCANMTRGIEVMGRLGIASWDCWDKPFLTEEGLAAAWCSTGWWGNGCSPCPKLEVKVKHEV